MNIFQRDVNAPLESKTGARLPRAFIAVVAVVVFAVLVADVFWLFSYALPRNPVIAAPAAPPRSASAEQRERYQIESDRIAVARWERARVVNTALGVPVVIVVLVGIGLIVANAHTFEHSH